jgi:hypothetical protein
VAKTRLTGVVTNPDLGVISPNWLRCRSKRGLAAAHAIGQQPSRRSIDARLALPVDC